jgi:hypothetical protein
LIFSGKSGRRGEGEMGDFLILTEHQLRIHPFSCLKKTVRQVTADFYPPRFIFSRL